MKVEHLTLRLAMVVIIYPSPAHTLGKSTGYGCVISIVSLTFGFTRRLPGSSSLATLRNLLVLLERFRIAKPDDGKHENISWTVKDDGQVDGPDTSGGIMTLVTSIRK